MKMRTGVQSICLAALLLILVGCASPPREISRQDIKCTLTAGNTLASTIQGELTLSGAIAKSLISTAVYIKKNDELLFGSALHTWSKRDGSEVVCQFGIRLDLIEDSEIIILWREGGGTDHHVLKLSTVTIDPQPPIVHTVQNGENMRIISMMYGMMPEVIMKTNGLTNSSLIAGQKLTIPRKEKMPNH